MCASGRPTVLLSLIDGAGCKDNKLRFITSNTSDAEVDCNAPFTDLSAEQTFLKYRCFFNSCWYVKWWYVKYGKLSQDYIVLLLFMFALAHNVE